MSEGERRRAGGVLVQLLVLLLVLIGAGAWNYHRNWQAEKQDAQPRPFEAYQSADLEALRDAYAQEVKTYQARYDAQNARRRRSDGQGLMDERVRDFERVQATAERLRELRADVAEREARLREVEAELALRAKAIGGLKLHLARLVTL